MFLLIRTTGFPVSLFLDAATAIGAGVVIGSFVGATGGALHGWTRKQVEGNTLRDGYVGALVVLGFWLCRECIVYAIRLWAA
jgi:hypothetical protein